MGECQVQYGHQGIQYMASGVWIFGCMSGALWVPGCIWQAQYEWGCMVGAVWLPGCILHGQYEYWGVCRVQYGHQGVYCRCSMNIGVYVRCSGAQIFVGKQPVSREEAGSHTDMLQPGGQGLRDRQKYILAAARWTGIERQTEIHTSCSQVDRD